MGDIHSFGFVHPTAIVLDPHLSVFLNQPLIRVGAHSRIDALVKLEGGRGLTIGKHVHIASFSHLNVGGGELVFGDHSGCSSNVVIASGNPDLSYRYICAADPPEHLHIDHKRTVIGKHVVIFANAVICPGVTVHDYAVVAAGAVVTKDVPASAIVAGVPARVIGSRMLGTDDGRFTVRYLPKLRDLAATRDITRVRAHYGDTMPEQMAVDLVEFVNELTEMPG